jgi:hypothetical protein
MTTTPHKALSSFPLFSYITEPAPAYKPTASFASTTLSTTPPPEYDPEAQREAVPIYEFPRRVRSRGMRHASRVIPACVK